MVLLLLMLLLLFDGALAPFSWCLVPPLPFNVTIVVPFNTPPPFNMVTFAFSWCHSLFLDIVFTFVPLQHHSYSSLTRLLFLVMQILLFPFQILIYSPLILLLVLVLDVVAIIIIISNWYFSSIHVFASVGKKN